MFGPIKRALRNKTTQDTKQVLYCSGCFYVDRQLNLAFLVAQTKAEFQQTK